MPVAPASSRGATSSGALTLLSTTTLSGSGTIDVSAIDQTYNDLFFVLIARGTRAAATDGVLLRLNNDSGANYDYIVLGDNSGAQSKSLAQAQTSAFVANLMPGNTATAGRFLTAEFVIPGYASTTWSKQVIWASCGESGTSSALVYSEHAAAFWLSTAAVTRITVFGQTTANLATGSTLRIYGRT